MAFVANPAVLVDQTMLEILALSDLRVTPGGGFQVVWEEKNGTSGAVLHETSYRIFNASGQPLTDEITDGSYYGDGQTPVHLRQSIELDDGTTLKVEREFTNSPLTNQVLRLYDKDGVPLGEPIFSASGAVHGGIAQLPNRDIVFVTDSVSKTGVYSIFARVLDNTSPDLYAPVLTRIGGADGAAQVAADGSIVVNFNELIALGPSARIDLKTTSGELVDSFDASDGADLSAWVSSLTIRPSVTLDAGTGYVLEFAAGSVADPSGNAFAGGAFQFRTAGDAPPPAGDATAPSVVDFFPGTQALPVDWSLGITFDEDVQAGAGTITLQTEAGEVVQTFNATGAGIQFFGASVVIDPAADLLPGTNYRLTAQAGAFQDLAGNAAPVASFDFTTAGEPPPAGDATAPVAIDFFPASGSNTLPPDWNLGITFSEAVEAGPGVITLQTAAGEVVQTFATESDPGIQFIGSAMVVNPAADLLPGTSYQLVVAPDAVVDLVGNAYAGVSGYGFTTAG